MVNAKRMEKMFISNFDPKICRECCWLALEIKVIVLVSVQETQAFSLGWFL